MATIYLRSTGGDDADNGSTWALAKATLAAALTAAGDGGLVYVSQAHAETTAAAVSMTSPGTAPTPVRVLCVNDEAEPPTALATTATVAMTGAGNNMTFDGFAYVYGITFNAGGTTTINSYLFTQTNIGWKFEACALRLLGSGATGKVTIGGTVSNDTYVHFLNTTVQFGSTAQRITLYGGKFIWEDTASAITGATIPGSLFLPIAARQCIATLSGVDLSALSTNNLVDSTIECATEILLTNCKLPSNASFISGTIPGQGGVKVRVQSCDIASTGNVYRFAEYSYQGSIISATNCKLNADYSMKMVSLAAGPLYGMSLISPPIAQWNATTGSALKATVEIISTATLKDDEIWLEIQYLATANCPHASFANDRHEHHIVSLVSGAGSGSNQDASTAAWTEDLASEIKQKLIVTTFTPEMAGYVIGKVYLAKANQTVYVDPYMTIEAA
jgi:hypothetical protein